MIGEISLESLQEAHDSRAELSERRIITVMFVDLAGFTHLSLQMDPEALSDLLNAYIQRVVPLIEKEGGVIDKIIGDGVMALFGAPTANVDDPKRALTAALAIRKSMREKPLSEDFALDVHIGINTGLVVAGYVGSRTKSYTVLGEAVNIAARLEGASKPGQILVGPQTYSETNDCFKFTPVEGLQFKGLSQEFTAYSLTCALERTPRQGSPRPMVGRITQKNVLENALQDLQNGRGGVVEIHGGALSGKTSLLDWAGDRARSRGIPTVSVASQADSDTTPYAPLRTLIEHILALDQNAPGGDAADHKDRLSELMGPEQSLETSLLKEFLGEESQSEQRRSKGLEESDSGPLFLKGVRIFFKQALQNRPLLVTLDDAQWLDQGSCRVLFHVLTITPRLPILIFCARRHDKNPGLDSMLDNYKAQPDTKHSHVSLGAFSDQELQEFCRERLGNMILEPGSLLRLKEFSSGNPYILDNLLEYLTGTGNLQLTNGEWRLVEGALDTIPLTTDIQRMLTSQIDRLDGHKKGVLRHAAIIGRSFPYLILVAILKDDATLEEEIHELEFMDILLENNSITLKEYYFKSPIVHSILYEHQLLSVRKEIHNKVGCFLESPEGQTTKPSLGVLAYHFIRAENWEKAQYYLERLGDFTARFANDSSSVAIYKSALKLYTDSFSNKLDSIELAKFHRKIGESLFRCGEYATAMDNLETARKHIGLSVPGGGKYLDIHIGIELFRLFIRCCFAKVKDFDADRNRSKLLGETFLIQEALCWIYFYIDAKLYFYETLRGARMHLKYNNKSNLVRSFSSLGLVFTILRKHRLAQCFLRRANALAKDLGESSDLSLASMCQGVYHEYDCRWSEALDCYQAAKDHAWASGRLQEWGVSVGRSSNVLYHLGYLDNAREICRNMHQQGMDSGDRQLIAYGLTGEGIFSKLSDKWNDAIISFRKSNDYLLAVRNHYVALWNSAHLIDCFIATNQPDELMHCMNEISSLILANDIKGNTMMIFSVKYLKGLRWLENLKDYSAKSVNNTAICSRILARSKHFKIILPELHNLEAIKGWNGGQSREASRHWERGLFWAEALDDLRTQWLIYDDRGKLTGNADDAAKAGTCRALWESRHHIQHLPRDA
ncbi:MAG: ATP-binding protein [Acidobacteriota bacterium]